MGDWGIPYSDDMTPRPGTNWPPLPLMENDRVVEAPVDRNPLTRPAQNSTGGYQNLPSRAAATIDAHANG